MPGNGLANWIINNYGRDRICLVQLSPPWNTTGTGVLLNKTSPIIIINNVYRLRFGCPQPAKIFLRRLKTPNRLSSLIYSLMTFFLLILLRQPVLSHLLEYLARQTLNVLQILTLVLNSSQRKILWLHRSGRCTLVQRSPSLMHNAWRT